MKMKNEKNDCPVMEHPYEWTVIELRFDECIHQQF